MTNAERIHLYESIGNQIKKLRKEANLSQEALATKLGLSRVSIVNIEKGRQHPPLHLLIDVSRELNISLSDLVNDSFISKTTTARKMVRLKNQINKANVENIDTGKILEFVKKMNNK